MMDIMQTCLSNSAVFITHFTAFVTHFTAFTNLLCPLSSTMTGANNSGCSDIQYLGTKSDALTTFPVVPIPASQASSDPTNHSAKEDVETLRERTSELSVQEAGEVSRQPNKSPFLKLT